MRVDMTYNFESKLTGVTSQQADYSTDGIFYSIDDHASLINTVLLCSICFLPGDIYSCCK